MIAESIPDIETSEITLLPSAETPRLDSPEERTTESMDDKKEPALSPIVASNSWFEGEDFSSIADAVMFDESDEIMLEIRPESLEMAEIPVDVAGTGWNSVRRIDQHARNYFSRNGCLVSGTAGLGFSR